MDNEIKRKIYEAYCDKSRKLEDISQEFGYDKTYIGIVAKSMGAPPRQVRAKRGGAKHCPKCHREIKVKGAKFCCFCGSDIRSERDVLIERIDRARECISLLPENARDEVQKLFVDIVAELNNKKKER